MLMRHRKVSIPAALRLLLAKVCIFSKFMHTLARNGVENPGNRSEVCTKLRKLHTSAGGQVKKRL